MTSAANWFCCKSCWWVYNNTVFINWWKNFTSWVKQRHITLHLIWRWWPHGSTYHWWLRRITTRISTTTTFAARATAMKCGITWASLTTACQLAWGRGSHCTTAPDLQFWCRRFLSTGNWTIHYFHSTLSTSTSAITFRKLANSQWRLSYQASFICWWLLRARLLDCWWSW